MIGFTVFANENSKIKTEKISDQATDVITISKVRIFLDDVEIFPTKTNDSGEANKNSDMINAEISADTILSFTKFKSGKNFSLKNLEKEVQQTQLRLLNSGYFYNATVEIVPPRKNPEKRTIIINVSRGFLYRIGGGGIYAMFGKVALGGKRNQLIGMVGWNVNGASYIDEHFLNLPVIIGATAYTNAPASFTDNGNGIEFNGKTTIGGFISPDLRFCVDTVGLLNSSSGFNQEKFIISPYFYLLKYINAKIYSTTEGRFYFKPSVAVLNCSGELCQTLNFSPSPRINFASLICTGINIGSNSEYSKNFLHDLNMDHSSVSENPGLSKRCIRSGYKNDELLLENYVMASFEARLKMMDFVIAGTFPCNIRPFIFTDVAIGQYSQTTEPRATEPRGRFSRISDNQSDDPGKPGGRFSWFSYPSNCTVLDAYGLGFQFNFDCPVFAYFNFAYGINHLGKGKFNFYTGISF